MHKASVMSVHAESNEHSADWLTFKIVNELAPPHGRSQQGQCVQQCRTILANNLGLLTGRRHDHMQDGHHPKDIELRMYRVVTSQN